MTGPCAGVGRIGVLIVDDSHDVRLEVVGEATEAEQARVIFRSVSPDVVSLDVEMPGMTGLEFLS